jgi:hypothetical protein
MEVKLVRACKGIFANEIRERVDTKREIHIGESVRVERLCYVMDPLWWKCQCIMRRRMMTNMTKTVTVMLMMVMTTMWYTT